MKHRSRANNCGKNDRDRSTIYKKKCVQIVKKKLIITKYDLVTSDGPNDSTDTLFK